MNARNTNNAAEKMKPEYDLDKMKVVRRGARTSVPPGKTRITIRIDTDVLEWFYAQVDQAGSGSYQATINQALRDAMQQQQLEPMLRRVVREELRRQRKAS